MSFLDNISDFYHWMAQFDEVNARSRTNYISWLKFLSNNYDLDEHITEDAIKGIIDSESKLLNSRPIYKSEKDLVNFKSALRKYAVPQYKIKRIQTARRLFCRSA